MSERSAAADGDRTAAALQLAALALVFVALFAWTWGRWPDALVDFGRELYVPWQLVEGKRLYAELSWFNGPLSPHWNAWMFRLFGVGLSTFVWVNAALFALILALLHHVLRRISSPFAATVACVVVMCTCGFGQLVGIGNYNFIAPYSHEMTHGTLLGLGALAALERWRGRASIGWVLAAGAFVGLAALTKPEMFVAALIGALAAIGMHVRATGARALPAVLAFGAGLVVPPIAACALMSASLGGGAAFRATLGAWPPLLSSDVSQIRFYRTGMGIDAPGANLLSMLAWAAGWIAVCAPAIGFSRWKSRTQVAVGLAFALSLVAMSVLYPYVRWLQAARPLPLFALACVASTFLAARRHRDDPRWPGAFAFSLFALAMLAKMALNARLIQYGFALAMPATALVSVALVEWLPELVRRRGWKDEAFRSGALGLLLAFCAVHVGITAKWRGRKEVAIGSGRDAFVGDVRSQVIGSTLDWLQQHPPAGVERPTLAVFPEGVTINYLARLENPTPYFNFMPPEIVLFGEDAIVAALRAHPPEVVLLTHKDTREYGFPWFGRDFAVEIGRWLQENYEIVQLYGDPPLQSGSVFGIAVLTRKR